MKLNNKGFAISTLLYGITLIGIMTIVLMLNIMSTSRNNSKDYTKKIKEELEDIAAPREILDSENPSYFVRNGDSSLYKIDSFSSSGLISGIIKLNDNDELEYDESNSIIKLRREGIESEIINNKEYKINIPGFIFDNSSSENKVILNKIVNDKDKIVIQNDVLKNVNEIKECIKSGTNNISWNGITINGYDSNNYMNLNDKISISINSTILSGNKDKWKNNEKETVKVDGKEVCMTITLNDNYNIGLLQINHDENIFNNIEDYKLFINNNEIVNKNNINIIQKGNIIINGFNKTNINRGDYIIRNVKNNKVLNYEMGHIVFKDIDLENEQIFYYDDNILISKKSGYPMMVDELEEDQEFSADLPYKSSLDRYMRLELEHYKLNYYRIKISKTDLYLTDDNNVLITKKKINDDTSQLFEFVSNNYEFE